MAGNQTKSKAPELSPTPEEHGESEGDESLRPTISRTRSGLSLQERILGCGSFGALLGTEGRMGRRPSTISLGPEGSAKERGDDDGSYFNLKRV
jgi:hypothetical protein